MRALTGLFAVLVATSAVVACGPPKQADAPPPVLDKPVPSSSTAPKAKQDPAADLKEAEDALNAKDFAKAKKAAMSAVDKDAKNPDAHYFLALAHDGAGERADAEKQYRAAIELSPGMLDAVLNLSALLLDDRRAADAVPILRAFLAKAKDKDRDAASMNLAVALSESGDHAGAATEYEKLAKKPGADAKATLGFVDALLAQGKKEDAAKAANEAVAKSGSDRDVLGALARRLGQAKAFPDAIATIDKAIKIKSGADLLTYRALFKRSLKDVKGAQVDLELATKEDPKFAPAFGYLGEVLEEQKKNDLAKKAYEKAIELGPDTPLGKKMKERLDGLGKPKK